MNADDLIGLAEPWTRLHKRVLDAPGAIIDLGCVTWDWSQRFFGTKRVIGADPFETDPQISGVELFPGIVTAVRGQVKISREGTGSSTHSSANSVDVEAITLVDLLNRFQVDEVAALKINTEGSEYELLIGMSEKLFTRIDQIAVSFHDFVGIGSPQATEAVIAFLSHWYDVTPIDARWNWYLFTRRRPQQVTVIDAAPSHKKLTLVTGLFDLATRDGTDRRSADEYLRLGSSVLALDQDVVCFADPPLASKIHAQRRLHGKADRTTVIPIPFEELTCYSRKAAAEAATRPGNLNPAKDTVNYALLGWAKFELLDRAITYNPFDASHFAWTDFGIAHVVDTGGPASTEPFDDPSDLIKLHMLRYFGADTVQIPNYWQHLQQNVAGGFFVGSKTNMRDLVAAFWRGIDLALSHGLRPLELDVLPYLALQQPDKFTFSYGDYPDMFRNHVRPRRNGSHLLWIMRDAREHKAWARSAAIGQLALDGYKAGTFDLAPDVVEKFLVEYYLAVYYRDYPNQDAASAVADYYTYLAFISPPFRETFRQHEQFVRDSFSYLTKSIVLP